ncbi:DEDD exonuclease domain-containing protein [uncultured Pseudokineococcus sp.]|uniref:DEDD exonuclease domain-containing protein n=1 Tax=uncultured Pseudokineococcus sp. TaxID=1642928 RepID=UPI002636FF92|nr:DEDD exonuclease domain-containing protein [uncultured Pseudokineococcus sp.]
MPAAPPVAPAAAPPVAPPCAPAAASPGPSAPRPLRSPVQTSLDDLGTPLHDVTFVVVDLETTGGSARTCAITEIGAVKVRGGEVLGELSTLVDPGGPVPPLITVLTGITDAMVAAAPPVDQVLAAFWEFVGDAVLVAHNAPFDTGFLRAAGARSGRPWPGNEVVCTVSLSRAVLGRDEVRDHKLGTLAAHLGSATTPTHRALDDARATVDVLHALLGRLGGVGVRTLEDLRDQLRAGARLQPARRSRRHLAEGLPSAPGVYLFLDGLGEVLYVGTSRDIRRRVRSYFTAGETRARMDQMVARAARVVPVVCPTPLEAAVRELRLIAEHRPAYNRRSTRPERGRWLKLTDEAFPRLSVVRRVADDGAAYLGPVRSARAAELAVEALHEAHPLRRCTARLPARPAPGASACALADLGRCGAPCTGAQGREEYARVVARVRAAMDGDARAVAGAGLRRAAEAAADERFEEASTHRDRLLAYLAASGARARLEPLAAAPELVAARRRNADAGGGWEVVLVRHGRLAGTAVAPAGTDPMPVVASLRAAGEVVEPPALPAPAALVDETELVARWLEQDGVRLVELEGTWASPLHGAAGLVQRLRLPASTDEIDHLLDDAPAPTTWAAVDAGALDDPEPQVEVEVETG